MIQEDEHIIYISQAKCAVTIKQIQSMKTGMLEKKIVITTRRVLFFQSLSNMVMEIQYQILAKKLKKQQQKNKKQPKKRVSINQFPQHSFPVNDRQCKIMIDEQASCHKYLMKIGLINFIKSITGIVILKNMPKMRFELLAFPTLKDGFRFCKALICAKAWTVYQNYCNQNNIKTNKMWSRILSQIANNQRSATLIDPQLFMTGSRQQIRSFLVLVNQIPFAHSFEHRYSIISNEITQYSQQFIQMFQQKTHSLIFRYNSLNVLYFNAVFSSKIKLQNLMHLDVSHNKLTDEVFATLQRLAKECKKLSTFNLSYNEINFQGVTIFVNFLKSTQVILNINLTHNLIEDSCIQTLEKFILMPSNPPISEINLSFNKFTPKGAWRLFVGNQKFHKYHTYMNFVIYPIPIKQDTFPQKPFTSYPKAKELINFNIHSALVEQFQQESFMAHTLHAILDFATVETIKIIRRLPPGIKLPRTKQQVFKSTQFANKIQNFMYSHQFVENVYETAEQIYNFKYNLSPVTRQRFIKYLSDKLNQALFIRDHYAVKYILRSFKRLGVDYQGYQPRIDRLMLRDQVVNKKIQSIINFQVDQYTINRQLDEIVREGLRLYLGGNGIQTVYYLKFLRDLWIQKLIKEKYNPQHFIYQKMADKNMNLDDQITQKQMIIPYQIRVQKKINQNFYLHPWQANYFTLTQILRVQYDQCLKFLQQSSKKQKFAPYFQRIQERIQFMKNQFVLFNYNKFKSSYSDLKINCARLFAMYRFIRDKQMYVEIPNLVRKLPITKQKIIIIHNEQRFKNDYHISRYPNINKKTRKARYFNYTNKMTRYGTEQFNQEYNILKVLMDEMFKILERAISVKSDRIPEQIVKKLQEMIKFIRQSTYPSQLKQEFYLRILSWRKGRHMNNKQILQYMSFITMYLRPPLTLQKYIIAGILSCESLNIGELPVCMVTDMNKATDITVGQLQKAYVERDWMSDQVNVLAQLMRNSGKVQLSIQLLTKKSHDINIPESRTVGEVVSNLASVFKDIEDVNHYWLYMGYVGDSSKLITLEESQHIGQLIIDRAKQEKYFVFKRRIYCPEWKYLYKKYSESMINHLFYDFKNEYLQGQFFINLNKMIDLAASMFLIDSAEDILPNSTLQETINTKLKTVGSVYKGYMPTQAISRFHRTPNDIVAMLRNKVNEKMMKKQHLKPIQIKKYILQQFEDYPEFFSSNYLFQDRNKRLVKVSFNWLQIYVNSQVQIQSVYLQKIISIIPMTKYLLINYHKQEAVTGKISLFGDQNKITAAAHDILTYCMIRIKMLSSSLYGAYRYELLSTKHIRVKEPTKDQQIIQGLARIKRSLAFATPTILDMETEIIPYFGQNRYIKSFDARKLYANASLQKLQLVDDPDENDDDDQNQNKKGKGRKIYNDDSNDLGTHNVFNTIYPKLNKLKKKMNQQNSEDIPMSAMRSFSEQPQLSAYDNINTSYLSGSLMPDNSQLGSKQPVQDPPKQQMRQPIQQQPPQLTPIKNIPSPDQQFQPITNTQKTRSRLPPPRNKGNR